MVKISDNFYTYELLHFTSAKPQSLHKTTPQDQVFQDQGQDQEHKTLKKLSWTALRPRLGLDAKLAEKVGLQFICTVAQIWYITN